MNQLFTAASLKKQSFYQMQKRRDGRDGQEGQVFFLVNKIRRDHPQMAVREIHSKIKSPGMGRDKFEQYCFAHGYRVQKRKNYMRTTDSTGVTRFPNLVKEIEVTGVNQVFVSDITYYEMQGRFYYITLIMDLFNREVVGFNAGKSLRTEDTTLPALLQARRYSGGAALEGAILHSDGGGQYYSHELKKLTTRLKMSNSMTEETVYENAHAERLNGIIKNGYLYSYEPDTFEKLQKELKRAVYMYNHEKPHKSLGKMTPVQYRIAHSADVQNNSSILQRYYQTSTEKQHQLKEKMIQREIQKMSNPVNVF